MRAATRSAHRILAPVVLTIAAPASLLSGDVRADTAAPQAPGIYLAAQPPSGHETLARLRGTMPQMKEKGLVKSMLLGGLSKPKMIVALDGPRAQLRAKASSPSFYFNLGSAGGGSFDPMAMMSGDLMPPAARNASEFVLVRLNLKDGNRETEVRQDGSKPSANGKDVMRLTVEGAGDAAFRVTPSAPLSPGEYAFYWGAHGFGGQLWDFGVDAQ
jgi:hypothetical protein